jgi:PAS domain S-box-containing protein
MNDVVLGAPVRSSLAKKTVIVTAVVSLLNLLFLAFLLTILARYEFNLEQQRKAREVLSIVAQLTTNIQFATGSLAEQNRDLEEQEQNQREVYQSLKSNLADLRLSLQNDPGENKRLDTLANLFDRSFEYFDRFRQSQLSRKRRGGKLYHDVYVVDLMDCVDSIEQELAAIEQKYGQIESDSDDLTRVTSGNNVYFVLIGAFLLNAICTIVAIIWFLRSISTRIKNICNNTINLGLNMPLLPESSGDDEIALLDRKFRDLAAYLNTAKSRETLILEHAADFICLLDDKGVIVMVSDSSASILGYATSDLMGRRLLSLLPEADVETLRKALVALVSNKDVAFARLQIKRGDGTTGVFTFRMRMNIDQKVICIASDITEQSALERALAASASDYRTILDSLPVAVIGLSQGGFIEDVSTAGQSMSGYTSTELVGKPLSFVLADIKDNIDTSQLAHNAGIAPMLQILNGAHDQKRFVEVSFGSYVESKSGAKCSLAALKDVSVQEQIESAKRDFINMIGHDLRSPLMSLYCTVNMIAESSPSQAMQDAERILQDLMELTTDFLSLGKLESGQINFDFAATTVSSVLAQMLDSFFADDRFKNLHVRVTKPVGDATILVDGEQLIAAARQLFLLVVIASRSGTDYCIDFELRGEYFAISVLSNGSSFGDDLSLSLARPYNFFIPGNLGLRGALCLGLVRSIVERHQGRLQLLLPGDKDVMGGLTISLPLIGR